jgi:hypothetical protein
MYKSPIELIVTEIENQVIEKGEEAIYTAVLHYIPNVDRAELLKALEYDRQQYEQGYRDAKNEIQHCEGCRYCFSVDGDDICRRPGLNGEMIVTPDGFCAWGESKNGSI